MALHPPLDRRDSKVGWIYEADASISTRFHFLEIQGRVFFKPDMGRVAEILSTESETRTHDTKTHGRWTTQFVEELLGFDHLQKVNRYSLRRLSLLT